MTQYVTNADLLKEVHKSKKSGAMSDELAAMLMQMVNGMSTKYQFTRYSYKDDMRSAALVALCTTWNQFDTKYDNAFAFYSTSIMNAFKTYLKYEKKHQQIRDKEMIYNGLNPSENFDREL